MAAKTMAHPAQRPAPSACPTWLAGVFSVALHATILGAVWAAALALPQPSLELSTGSGANAPDTREVITALLDVGAPTPEPSTAPADPASTPMAAPDPTPPPTPPQDTQPPPSEHENLPELDTPEPSPPMPAAAAPPIVPPPTPSLIEPVIIISPDQLRAIVAELKQAAAHLAAWTPKPTSSSTPAHPHPATTNAQANAKTSGNPTPASSNPSSTTPGTTSSAPSASGGATTSPSPLSGNRPPIYPLESRRLHQQGTATLLIQVLPSGKAGVVTLTESSSFPALDDAAISAAHAWRFTPASFDGHPVECQVTLPVRFSLDH